MYCRLRCYLVGGAQYAPGQRKIIRDVGEHSDSLRAAYGGCSLDAHCGGCVRPYGSAGADGFTNGVPRSYLRAPSLAALPQQSESTTGRAGTRVAVRLWDCTSQSRQARARSEGKNRLFDSEINLRRLFVTIYCRLRRYPVGGAQCAPRQRKIIWFVGEHSDSLRAAYGGCSLDAHCGGCVRPYGSAGADEFTNGVPRSYLRAPSLAALPQFTVAHPTEKIVHTEKYSRS